MIDLALIDNLARREDVLILLNLGSKRIKKRLIRGRIIDIFEVLLRGIDSAEVVDERLGVRLIGAVSRDYPRIDPEVRALLGDSELKIGVAADVLFLVALYSEVGMQNAAQAIAIAASPLIIASRASVSTRYALSIDFCLISSCFASSICALSVVLRE